MILKNLALFTEVYFARAGATIDSVVVSRTVKPDNNPTSNWTNIGNITEFAYEPRLDVYTQKKRDQVFDHTITEQGLVVTFSSDELSVLWAEIVMGTASVAGASIVPLAKTTPLQGYLKIQQEDIAGNIVLGVDLYCTLLPQNTPIPMRGVTTAQIRAEVLQSTQNSGSITQLV